MSHGDTHSVVIASLEAGSKDLQARYVSCIGREERLDLSTSTLILPSLSVGSIPQLAIDLVISHLSLSHIGFIIDPNVQAFVGVDPLGDGSQDIASSIDVYQSIDGRITLFQQRAPPHRSAGHAYVESLFTLIRGFRPGHTLLLTSIDASFRPAEAISVVPYILSGAVSPLADKASAIGLEPFIPVRDTEEVLLDPSVDAPANSVVPLLPGGAGARAFLLAAEAASFPMDALIMYAHSGYSPHLVHSLASAIYQLFSIPIPAETLATEPPSWRSLFGSPPTPSLYG